MKERDPTKRPNRKVRTMTLEDFLLKLNELRAVLLDNLRETEPFTKTGDLNADWVLLVDFIRAIDHVKSLSTTMMGYFVSEEPGV